MTYEEAIEIIKKNKPVSDPRKCGEELCEACDIAIEALGIMRHYDEECLQCKHLHCDTWCDHGECFDQK